HPGAPQPGDGGLELLVRQREQEVSPDRVDPRLVELPEDGDVAGLEGRQVEVGGADDEGLIPLVAAAVDEGGGLGGGAGDDEARNPHDVVLEAGGVEALDLIVLGDQDLPALVPALLDAGLLVLDVTAGDPDLDEAADQVADVGVAAVSR